MAFGTDTAAFKLLEAQRACDAKDAEIARLREDMARLHAENKHWRGLLPASDGEWSEYEQAVDAVNVAAKTAPLGAYRGAFKWLYRIGQYLDRCYQPEEDGAACPLCGNPRSWSAFRNAWEDCVECRAPAPAIGRSGNCA